MSAEQPLLWYAQSPPPRPPLGTPDQQRTRKERFTSQAISQLPAGAGQLERRPTLSKRAGRFGGIRVSLKDLGMLPSRWRPPFLSQPRHDVIMSHCNKAPMADRTASCLRLRARPRLFKVAAIELLNFESLAQTSDFSGPNYQFATSRGARAVPFSKSNIASGFKRHVHCPECAPA